VFLQSESTPCDSKSKSNFKRDHKYQDNFIKFVFTFTLINKEQHPKCIICLEISASDSIKLNELKLKQHLEIKHPQYVNNGSIQVHKEIKYFQQYYVVTQKALTAFLED
jgi:hypothetical protein